ncbi:hypothetical protein [Reyranella sp.]|uniref:hypothetical protein n=1 Tax=Reyranella sp. TaxID=1929291 RepID=UPI003BA8DE62
MRRVLFIGNSHLAALKNGLAELSPNLNYEPVFFGLHGDLMRQVGIRGSCLVPLSAKALRTSRAIWGVEAVDCSEYDVICLVGMGSNIRTLHPLVSEFQTTDGPASGDRHVISTETYRSAVVGLFGQSLAGFTARNVQKATQKPLFLVPQPAPDHKAISEEATEGARPGRNKKVRWLRQLAYSEESAALSKLIPEALLEATGASGYVPQPQETLETPFTTKSEFMSGSKRLMNSRAHEKSDNIHANALYGQLVLESVNGLN